MPMDPSLLSPGKLQVNQPICRRPVGNGPVSWPCSLIAGHDQRTPEDPEPCYATESDPSRRIWQQWAARQIDRQAQRQAATQPAPAPRSEDPVADQFSAATGAQAAIRAQQMSGQRAPEKDPSAQAEIAEMVQPEDEDPNDRHGYPADGARHSTSSEAAAYTPFTYTEAVRFHLISIDELELGDYVVGFDDEDADGHTPGLTVMRIDQVRR